MAKETKADKTELHTEGPISEKDEVKKAEDRTRKANEADVAAELKLRDSKKK
jgi:hypothetical protein